MKAAGWKVGELASRTGLSVRALHHYDAVGLLPPDGRSEAGHRLYSEADLSRLQQIKSLRQLGFSLKDIGRLFAEPGYRPECVIEEHVRRLRAHIQLQQSLLNRLERLAAAVARRETLQAEDLFDTIKEIEMSDNYSKHYTPEQLDQLKERAEGYGEAQMRAFEAEWAELIAKVQAESDAGTPANDPEVQKLAKRWMELVEAFTGGDPGIRQSLDRVWQEETNVHGYDAENMRRLGEYISKGLEATKR